MKKKALFTVLTASLMCAAAAVTLAACGDDEPAAVTKYKVTYAGGETTVTGTAPTEADHAQGDKFNLKANTFTNEGKDFDGWKYGETTYKVGAEFTMPASDVTFTAIWKPAVATYDVTYVLGEGGSWVNPDEAPATSVAQGTEITLPGLYDVSKDGQEITGWTIDGQPYDLGASYTVNGDVTITAVWGTEKFTVAYSGGAMGKYEIAGRYEAGTEITVIALPAEWASETKEFQSWQYSYYDEDDEDADADGLVTKTYQADDKFTVPAGGATLTAKWKNVGINVTFVADKDDFETEPVTVLYKPADLANPTEAELAAFMAQVPGAGNVPTGITVPDGMSFYWLYDKGYEENDLTYVQHVVCDMEAGTIAMLKEEIEAGTEEAEVYGFVGKVASNFTAANWYTPSADSVNISYGQTVTLTGDMTTTAKGENGAHADYEGIFVSVGQTNSLVSVMMLYHKGVLNNSDGDNFTGLTNNALGVKSATAATLYKENAEWTYEPIDYSAATVAAMLGGIIGNYKVVVDYTSATQIVVTTSFTSVVEGEAYKYEGVLTLTAADAHAGLAQTYKLAICGEAGSSLKNGLFTIAGTAGTLPTIPGHDWTEDNGYKCTICGQINDEHPHNFVEEVCTICGAVDTEHHTIHRYGDDGGFCTVCGNAYSITVDGTTYTGELTSAAITNNDNSGAWWDGKTSNVEIGAGDQVAVISWEKTRDANYYDVRLDISGEEGKDANDPWGSGGVFRLGPNVFEGAMTNGEEVVTTGTLPADATDGASLGSYKAIVVKAGNKMIVSLQCYRDGALFWSQTVTVDLTNTKLPTGTLYFRIAGNPTFCDDFTAATGTLTAANAD